MKHLRFDGIFRKTFRVLFIAVMLSAGTSLFGADLKLQAKLIWGTNDDAEHPKHKLLDDPKLTDYLRGIFKWKRYYEITNQVASISGNATKTLTMSRKCSLKIKNLGNSRIEVDLYGEGKLTSRGVHSLPPGERVALGGTAKNDTAWFIVLQSADPKASDARKAEKK